jgi:hypothetical protein
LLYAGYYQEELTTAKSQPNIVCRVSTGLENPGKFLNWKKNKKVLESPGINFLDLQLCQH